MKHVTTALSFALCVVVAAIPSAASAAVVTGEAVTFKYLEILSRKVKFVHLGPFIGDQTILDDKGSIRIAGQMSLAGIDITKLTPTTGFNFQLKQGSDLLLSESAQFNGDPDYEAGDTKATIKDKQTFMGKEVRVSITKLQVTVKDGVPTLRFSIAFHYLAETINGSMTGSVGIRSVLARDNLGQPTGDISGIVTAEIHLLDGSEDASSTANMAFVGGVKTTQKNDPHNELSPANASTVVIQGTSL